MSRARCIWNHEAAVNQQIGTEFAASHAYHALWAHFARDDVAMPKVAAFEIALQLEKDVNECILRLHAAAGDDPAFSDFLESEFVGEQVDAIQELAGYVAQLTRIAGDGAGLLEWDRALG